MGKLSALKEKERQFIIECIQLYRNLPALWNVKSKVYRDRNKKNMAYDLLHNKYQEVFPEATMDDVKKKLNALRTNYRKELKKHKESMKSGASKDSVYESTLWYFDEMNFLQDHEIPCGSETSIEDNDVKQNTESLVFTMDNTDECRNHGRNKAPQTNLKRKTSKKRMNEERLLDLAHKRERLSEKKDEYDYWAMAWAADLRKMDQTQQAYAKKAIADILMEGQLGNLHCQYVKNN